MPPAAGPPAAPVGADAEHVRAGARRSPRRPARRRSPSPRRATTSLTTIQTVAARRAHVPRDDVGVGAGDREHRRAELAPRDAGPLERLLGGVQQRLHRRLRADRVLVARPAMPEVQRPALEVEHRRERLGRAAVDAQHEARLAARLRRASAPAAARRAGLRFIGGILPGIRGGAGLGSPSMETSAIFPQTPARGGDVRVLLPARRLPREPVGRVDPPHRPQARRAARRRGRCGARCSTPRRGRPFMHKLTTSELRARRAAGSRSASRDSIGPGRRRGRAAARRAGRCASTRASAGTAPPLARAGSTARRCRARSSRAPRRRRASTASLELPGREPIELARLARDGRPQLGRRARRALDLAARRRLRRARPRRGSTSRSGA